MESLLCPVPPDRVALTGLSWHQGCEVLNATSPHFRMHMAAGKPACDIILTISQKQLDAACPIVISIKGVLRGGAVMLSLMDTDSKTRAAILFSGADENQDELVVIPATAQLILRIAAADDAATEFALTYLHLSYSPDEVVHPLPSADPVVFPNWDRVYQPAHLTAMERLRRLHYRALTAPTPMPWHRDLRIMLHPHDGLSRILATCGFYEPHELMVLKKLLCAGDTFIDCGANIGFYTLYAASLVGDTGRVLAFEPSPREMKRLSENITLNRLPHITTFTCALSDHEGEALFSIAQSTGENTLGESFGYTDTGLTQRITVPLRMLDTIIKEQGVANIKLIKIDVEGTEGHVLRGAQNILAQMRPALLFEVFPAALLHMKTTPKMIDDMLRAAGYQFYSINPVTAEWQALPSLEGIHHCTNILAVPE